MKSKNLNLFFLIFGIFLVVLILFIVLFLPIWTVDLRIFDQTNVVDNLSSPENQTLLFNLQLFTQFFPAFPQSKTKEELYVLIDNYISTSNYYIINGFNLNGNFITVSFNVNKAAKKIVDYQKANSPLNDDSPPLKLNKNAFNMYYF